MLILLPVILLLVTAVALLLIRWMRPEFTFFWVIAVVAALVSWIGVAALRLNLPLMVTLPAWQPAPLLEVTPTFTLDRVAWAYGLSVLSLVLAVILTASARGQYQSSVVAWSGALILGALGMLSIMAANPVTLLMTWTIFDLVELAIMLRSDSTQRISTRSVIAYAARTLGSIFVLWGIIISHLPGEPLEYSAIQPGSGLFFLLGAGLRLGVFPLHLPFASEPRMRRGIGSLLRLIPAASALAMLARLPDRLVPLEWMPSLLTLTVIAALFSSLMWITASDEIDGRPYWMIGFAALAVACVIRSDSAGSMAWGTVLLLPGGLLFLYSARSPRLSFWWILGLWGLSGVPYSPAASGWHGLLIAGPLPELGGLFFISVLLFMLGYARQALRPGDSLGTMEPWVRGIYPLGLSVIPVVQVIQVIAGWPGSREPGVWWAGVIASALLATSLVLRIFQPAWMPILTTSPMVAWVNPLFGGLLRGFNALFRLEWFYRLIWLALTGLGKVIDGLTAILEGDGAVLWALLLLTLVITFLQGSRNP
ncbi:MAG: hypothetical protein PHQ40_13345 [Anaerolineaceae bacterium]|nr:hypothetical protein [Anaerolineaceae bacterium]